MTTTTPTQPAIPGYQAGIWTIDPVHSEVSFTVRHLAVSKVRGSFRTFSGEIITGETPPNSSVRAVVQMSSVDTGVAARDDHLRSADFFDVDVHPTMTYRSTGVREAGLGYVVDGELTLKSVTRPVTLNLQLNGFAVDPDRRCRVGITATATIRRSEYGIDFSPVLEAGGVLVSDNVDVHLGIEAVLNQ